MFRSSSLFILSVLTALLFDQVAVGEPRIGLKDLSLNQLEQRLAEIDTELEDLALYNFRGGVGSIGYQSNSHDQPDNKEWVRIELGQAVPIDEIILVPTLRRDTQAGLQSEGFPVRFRVLAGTGQTTNVVASFTEEDDLQPRVAPLAVPCPSIHASWVCVEATELSKRGLLGQYALQLSEILVFSGPENVALAKPVSVSSSKQRFKSRQTRFLVDGFIPYRMDAARGIKSKARFFGSRERFQNKVLTIDLQEPLPVNQIHFHAADTFQTIPEDGSGSAIPPHILVTGANRPDFADETLLFEFKQESISEVGPIMCHRFPEKTCRYVRINFLEFQRFELRQAVRFNAGFAEIEVLSKGRNVALGKPVSGEEFPAPSPDLAPLTDGYNYFGEILPMRDWLNQLAKRQDLETERPEVVAALSRRYALQKRNLNIMYWLAAALAAGTIIVILLERMIRQRAVFKERERIAANLHDELGASLHAVGLYGKLAQRQACGGKENAAWDKLVKYIDGINTLAERAAKKARFCTNMLEEKELYENPAEEMKRAAERILIDLEHDISFTGAEMLTALHPGRRIGLLLFYRECLTNIIRHSAATRVDIHLTADGRQVLLTVQDNGKGVKGPPPSLKRRARLLKAGLSVESCAEGGTKVELFLKVPRRIITKAVQ
jgi:signal transduction histidine kinase